MLGVIVFSFVGFFLVILLGTLVYLLLVTYQQGAVVVV
jgi:hypothetical protein